MGNAVANANWVPDDIDEERPSAARVYDYILGGGHNFAVDRTLAEHLLGIEPNIRGMMAMNRAFMRRAVLFLMSQGIRQFLDLGSGIPTVGNVHEIAHRVDPETRVMYVDYEAVAVAHSELLLADEPNAAILQADARQVDVVLSSARTQAMIDFSEPVGLLGLTLLHYIADEQEPGKIIDAYKDVLVPGSHLVLTHGASDLFGPGAKDVTETMKSTQDNIFLRSKPEVSAFFAGFEMVEPGLVPSSYWRPDSPDEVTGDPSLDGQYVGVGYKR